MLIKQRLMGGLLGLTALVAGALVTTADAMGPPDPQQTKFSAADRTEATGSAVDMNDIIRSLPGGR